MEGPDTAELNRFNQMGKFEWVNSAMPGHWFEIFLSNSELNSIHIRAFKIADFHEMLELLNLPEGKVRMKSMGLD